MGALSATIRGQRPRLQGGPGFRRSEFRRNGHGCGTCSRALRAREGSVRKWNGRLAPLARGPPQRLHLEGPRPHRPDPHRDHRGSGVRAPLFHHVLPRGLRSIRPFGFCHPAIPRPSAPASASASIPDGRCTSVRSHRPSPNRNLPRPPALAVAGPCRESLRCPAPGRRAHHPCPHEPRRHPHVLRIPARTPAPPRRVDTMPTHPIGLPQVGSRFTPRGSDPLAAPMPACFGASFAPLTAPRPDQFPNTARRLRSSPSAPGLVQLRVGASLR